MAFLINLNQVYYCLIFRRACYFTFPLRFIQIFKNTSRKWTKVCNWKCVNPSRSLPLSVHKAAWARVYTPPPPNTHPLESQLLHMVWSWNICQRYFLTKDVDWWGHCFGHVTHMYLTDHKNHFFWRHHKWKNYVINVLLLSRGATGEILKLIRPPDPKIFHGR